MASETIDGPYGIDTTAPQPVAQAPLAETLRRCAETGRSVFLFGGDASSIRALRGCVSARHPDLRIAGICDADFSGPASHAILDHIAACAPDFVVVDLPAKRHRALIAEVAARGLRFTLINRPGSFAPYAATGAKRSPTTAPWLAAILARELATGFRFAGLVLRQLAQQRGPRLSTRD